ncbi:MAG: oligopeptide/dipeptide ABC transporter ATP-binding protein, partial [Candidatus Latescibacterota bacterium]|nr:oligopeptide/dipeptide ABC transporter ATP-binding protein [Candidatus Latescibacterota bacterium]
LFRIHRERNISLVYITHDLTTAYQLSHTILIMYRGDVVEVGDVEQVIKAPRHPYTQLLVRSIPLADTKRRWGEDPDGEPAPSQGGAGPETTEQALSLANGTGGCPFADRCPHVMASCQQTNPSLVLTDPGRAAACHLYEEAPALSAEQIATLSHGGTEGT